jgi:hypothetical protein
MAGGWSINSGRYVHNGRPRGKSDRRAPCFRQALKPDRLNQQSMLHGRVWERQELTLTERLLCCVALGFRGPGKMVRTLFVTGR